MIPVEQMREYLGSVLADVHFTRIERRVMFLLADGEAHPVQEVVAECLRDKEATVSNISEHVGNIRRKVKVYGHHITCESHGTRKYYRYVILLQSVVARSMIG